MRYELDKDGYIKTVLWGCMTGTCAEYTGEVPTGYSSLIEWADNACVNAYYLDDSGNLIIDAEREAELKALYSRQEQENTPILNKDIEGLNLRPKLLWTNPDVTVEVAGSTAYDLGEEFPLYLVFFNTSTSNQTTRPTICVNGRTGEMNHMGNLSSSVATFFLKRTFTIEDATATFSSCYLKQGESYSEKNTYLIPYQVYGIGTN